MEVLPEFHISGNAGRAVGSSSNVALGKPTGLYNLVLGDGQNAFVGRGKALHVCLMKLVLNDQGLGARL